MDEHEPVDAGPQEVERLVELQARRTAGHVGLLGGAALHLMVLALVAGTVSTVSGWRAPALLAAWVAGAVAIVRLARHRPVAGMLIPFAIAAMAWAALSP
jgi:hypothetical protein